MMYKVIKFFTDLQDNNFAYNVGDTYPRNGFEVLPSRIKELASKKNRQGEPVIEKFNDEEPKKKNENK